MTNIKVVPHQTTPEYIQEELDRQLIGYPPEIIHNLEIATPWRIIINAELYGGMLWLSVPCMRVPIGLDRRYDRQTANLRVNFPDTLAGYLLEIINTQRRNLRR